MDGKCRKHCRGACGQHRREILHQTLGGDGDLNLADVWPTITRVGAEPEAGKVRRVWEAQLKLDRLIVRVLGVHDDEECHGTRLDEYNT